MVDPVTVLWMILIIFISQSVQATTGFGFGIIAMALLPLVMPSYVTALCTCTLVSLIGTMYLAIKHRRSILIKIALPIIAASLIAAYFATKLMLRQSDTTLRWMIGVFLIIFAVYSIFFKDKIHIKGTPANGVIAGGISGLTSGLFNIGGPPVVIYVLNVAKTNAEYLATIQICFMLSHINLLVLRAANGMITSQVLWYSLFGLIGIAGGLLIGGRIFSRLDKQKMERFIYVFLVFMGIWLIINH